MAAGDYLGAALGVFATFKPKIVLTAPDGSQLWIDAAVAGSGAGGGAPLWPQGFDASLKFGDIPIGDAKVTDSPSAFLVANAGTLARAPGPAGVPWGVWLLALAALVALPYLPLVWRRR